MADFYEQVKEKIQSSNVFIFLPKERKELTERKKLLKKKQSQKYYKKNKKKISKKKKIYYEQHKEEIKKNVREWRKKNPEYCREYSRNKYRNLSPEEKKEYIAKTSERRRQRKLKQLNKG